MQMLTGEFEAALTHIKFVFPKMLSVVCFSHTLDNVGNHFKVPDLPFRLEACGSVPLNTVTGRS